MRSNLLDGRRPVLARPDLDAPRTSRRPGRALTCVALGLLVLASGCSGSGSDTPDDGGSPADGSTATPDSGMPGDDDGGATGGDGGDDGGATGGDDGGTTTDDDGGGPVGDLPRFVQDDMEYEGAFRLSNDEHGVSSVNYAVGVLGYNPDNHSLFIAGHSHHNAVAEFAIPDALGTGTGDVEALPEVATPLQDFTEVLDESPNGNPEGQDKITGMLWVDGQLLINTNVWYDAPGDAQDTTLVVRDADDLGGDIDGYFELDGRAHAAGYMAPIPAAWTEELGSDYLAGWASNYSIISRYSVGPSLFAFDPTDITGSGAGAEGPVETTRHMAFPHGDTHLGADALTAMEGSAPALWNFLSDGVYGFIVPGTRTFAVFGSTGGIDSGIGYKIVPYGHDEDDPCGGYCAYDPADYTNYYWFFDIEEILAASEPHEPRPYDYGSLSIPFDDGGAHGIIGGTFDPDGGILYLAIENAAQTGSYDRPPLIVAYSVGL